jgi:hypothetical protein
MNCLEYETHLSTNSNIQHPFKHATPIQTLNNTHSNIQHLFKHTTPIQTYNILLNIQHPLKHATLIQTNNTHSNIQHPFKHTAPPWPCEGAGTCTLVQNKRLLKYATPIKIYSFGNSYLKVRNAYGWFIRAFACRVRGPEAKIIKIYGCI